MATLLNSRNIMLGLVSTLLSYFYFSNAQLLGPVNPPPENARLDFIGLAKRYGFSPLRHEVTTEDGYILTLFHIPGRSRYPVLLVHGIPDTSDTWMTRGENSLGVTLANDGYDVWFANSRGNRYSRRHVSLDPDDSRSSYWSFSFHEMGYYDLPAIIDFMLNETQAPNITAIGHSRGNTMFYVLGSTRPEYNAKINVMIALAPVWSLRNTNPPVSNVIQLAAPVNRLMDSFGIRITEVLGYNSTPTKIFRAFCTSGIIGHELCLNVLFVVFGYDPKEFEPSFLDIFLYHFPAGTSWTDILHFSQIYRNFAQFDYGTDRNLAVYNSPIPPAYNLSLATMPFALIIARNDALATVTDAEILRSRLPNVVDYIINRRALMNHLDFVLGRTMDKYLFPDIFRVLTQYNQV